MPRSRTEFSATKGLSIKRETVMLCLLAVLVFFIYSNTLQGPFLLDDGRNIQDNPNIRLTELTLEGLARAAGSNRPIARITFALNYYFHQYNVMGYHLVNILVHIATGILLYFFAGTTLNTPSLSSMYTTDRWVPLFTALLWVVHPIQTQSVSYIVQRMNSMAAMFYVLSFLLYAKARLAGSTKRKWALFAGCTFAGVLALGSKETAATLPFFIFLYEWYFFQDLSWTWLKRHLWGFAAILILMVLVAFMYLGAHPFERILSGYKVYDFTLTQRLLTESRVVIYYISLLTFPHPSRLNLDYDFPLSHSVFDPITTLLSILAIAGLIALAFYLAKKQRLVSFCILWFLGNLVIESSVIALDIVFEHRTYLPSMLVSLTAVTLAYRYLKPEWLSVALLCAAVIVCCIWTYERNSVWGDDVALWKDCVEKSPNKERPHSNLGLALARQGRLEEAITHYLRALKINPDRAEPQYNLGLALAQQGKLEEAINHFSRVLKINPDRAEPYYNLGLALAQQGRLEEALNHFSKAFEINPDYGEPHYNLGLALAEQGRLQEAFSHFSKAFKINPDYGAPHYNLGLALAEQGRLDEAINHFSKALKINPDHAKLHYNLGLALAEQGRLEDAISYFSKALKIDPDYATAHNNLGAALARQGRLEEAFTHFSKALKINPDNVEALNNLGGVLHKQGNLDEAIRHYDDALRINPDDAMAHYNLGIALSELDRTDEAIRHYDEVLRINPDDAMAHYSLGIALHKQGKLDEAIRHYSRAVRIDPDLAIARHNLDLALRQAGKHKDAPNTFKGP